MTVLATYAISLYLLVSYFSAWEHVRMVCAVLVLMATVEAGWGMSQQVWGGALRPSGTFFNPNFLAGYLVAMAVFVAGVVSVRRARRVPWGWAGSAMLATVLAGAALATGSRGAVLALAAGAILVLGLRHRLKGVAAVLALLGCVALLPNPVSERLRAEHRANPLSYARIQVWMGAMKDLLDHPMGIGLGLYQYVYPLHPAAIEGQITRYGRTAQNAHNEYLQIGVEVGVLGLIVFLWGVAALGCEARSLLRRRLRRLHRGVIIGASGGVTTILVHAMVDANLHEPALAMLLACLAAVILSARQWATHDPYEACGLSITAPRWRLVTSCAGVGLVCVAVMAVTSVGLAWDAHETGTKAAAQQDYPRAVEAYRSAIALDPGKALYHSSLAAAHYQTFIRTNQRAAAEASLAELKIAVALNPLDGRLPALLGMVYGRLAGLSGPARSTTGGGLSSEQSAWVRAAKSAYESALIREPFSPFYRLELARLTLVERNHRGAEVILRELLHREPNFLPARSLLAKVLMVQGQETQAEEEYREVLSRRQQFAHWTKDALERQYLDVDAARLAADLHRGPAGV
ncbi:MAG: tetratricopeptide repeat protein [Nitrospira sp.]|nr:MAG: tetratricopeptide repeat protein [Nitrospira sp.]